MTKHAAARNRIRPALLWLLLTALPLAANQRPAAGSKRSSSPPPRTGDNVLLITIDTLRADHLGCYGYKAIHTPAIDALARDGIRYPMAISQVPLTLPEHVAIMTGTYPFHNQVQDFTAPPLAQKFRTLAQAFHDHGYATGAVVSSFVLDRSWGLDRGFDYYDDKFAGSSYLKSNLALVERRADGSVDAATAWLAHHRDRPFFFWLHLYDPHSPYNPPEPFRTQYRGREYDGEIAYADSQLGRLTNWLKRTDLYQRTSIVLLSDHGESLGQHGEKEHGFFIYNSTVHVPLIIKPAAGATLKLRLRPTSAPVESIAVAPTILQMADIGDRIQKQFDSPGLFAEGTSGLPIAAYSETFYPFSSFGWSPLHGLETEKYHYIDAPRSELYKIENDPGEENNVAAGQDALASVLKNELHKRIQEHAPGAAPAPSGLDESATAKLRALGYMAYRAPVSEESLRHPLTDPKDKLAEFNSILRATDAIDSGHFRQASELLARLRRDDPAMYILPFMQGELALRQQRAAEAAQYFQDCLKLAPNFDQAMTGLAGALQTQGKPAEAIQWLQRALERNPQNFRAWYEMGWIQERGGDQASAMASLHKALEIQPGFAPAYRDLGLVQFARQDYAAAAVSLQKAADLKLNEPTLFNYLGICYSRTNRLPDALRSYRQALKLNPGYAEAHLNLGFVYQRMNQQSAARLQYASACRLDRKLCKLVPGQ